MDASRRRSREACLQGTAIVALPGTVSLLHSGCRHFIPPSLQGSCACFPGCTRLLPTDERSRHLPGPSPTTSGRPMASSRRRTGKRSSSSTSSPGSSGTGLTIRHLIISGAVNRVVDAILTGRPRLLATMATGTGKTAVAFSCSSTAPVPRGRSGTTKQPLPEGRKNYTKTVPLQFEELAPCQTWLAERQENERAWKVPAAELLAAKRNLDRKNPHANEDIAVCHPNRSSPACSRRSGASRSSWLRAATRRRGANPSYPALIKDLSALLESARRASARAVNALMTATSWEIGRRIVEYEQQGERRAEYGADLLERLSADLTRRFGRGFSRQDLQYMRQFYWPSRQARFARRRRANPNRRVGFPVSTPSPRHFRCPGLITSSW